MRNQQQHRRKLDIIQQLSDLSKNGWSRAIAADYEPLERELRQIYADQDRDRRRTEEKAAQRSNAIDRNGRMEP